MPMDNREKFEALDQVIAELRHEQGALMPIMQRAQEIFGYLPEEVQSHIAKGLGIPLSDVYGVATFYAQFKLKPVGKYNIGICLGTACYVKGAQLVLNRLEEELGVKAGETTPDGLFTLNATRCLGACGLAPVIMIDDVVYQKCEPSKMQEILDQYQD